MRREAIDKVGCLDEDFFMYGEDIDLSYRVLKGGYQNYYLPALMLHYKGESTQKSSFRYVHVFYEAMLIFFKKHYSGMSLLISFPIKVAIYAKATLALLRMQLEKARKSLGFVDRKWENPFYLFVGGKEMIENCQRLALRKGLQAKFLICDNRQVDQCVKDALKKGSEVKTALSYVVFDTSMFSYELIFSEMASHPDVDRKVAFYHLDSGKLITENDVMW